MDTATITVLSPYDSESIWRDEMFYLYKTRKISKITIPRGRFKGWKILGIKWVYRMR